jgi:hypothetical protein
MRPYLKKTHNKKGLVEWLKVLVLSSNPSTTKNKDLNKHFFKEDTQMAKKEH